MDTSESLLGSAGTTEAPQTDAPLLGDSQTSESAAPGETPITETPASEASGEGQPSGAPETYETFKMPEGVEYDTALFEKVSPVFKELNLTQDQAQKLVDVYADQAKAIDEAYEKQIQDQRKEWREEFKKNPEAAKELSFARKALDHFTADDGEAKALFTGLDSFLSDHPAVARVFARVGKFISEDHLPEGTPGGTKEKISTAKKLFPSMN